MKNPQFAIRTPRSRAFTLIELLVVIAIISLLVSILLPSLRQAMDLAKETVCSSSVRSLALAVIMYAQDNDGYAPYVYDPDQEKTWHETLSAGYISENAILVCPMGQPAVYDPDTYGQGFALGMMRTASQRRAGLGETTVRILDSPEAYSMGLVADSIIDSRLTSWPQTPFEGWQWYYIDPGNGRHRLSLRHRRCANMAFVKGNVDRIDEDRVLQDFGAGSLYGYAGLPLGWSYWPD